jgi:hypothetical protein
LSSRNGFVGVPLSSFLLEPLQVARHMCNLMFRDGASCAICAPRGRAENRQNAGAMPARLALFRWRGHHARMTRIRRHPFRLLRFAHCGSARVFAYAMAVLLALANVSVGAAPDSAAMWSGAHVVASASPHHHCDAAMAKTIGHTPASHDGKSCPCCAHGGGDCACAHVCPVVLLAALLPDFAAYPVARWLPSSGPSVVDAIDKRRLRPPIV